MFSLYLPPVQVVRRLSSKYLQLVPLQLKFSMLPLYRIVMFSVLPLQLVEVKPICHSQRQHGYSEQKKHNDGRDADDQDIGFSRRTNT